MAYYMSSGLLGSLLSPKQLKSTVKTRKYIQEMRNVKIFKCILLKKKKHRLIIFGRCHCFWESIHIYRRRNVFRPVAFKDGASSWGECPKALAKQCGKTVLSSSSYRCSMRMAFLLLPKAQENPVDSSHPVGPQSIPKMTGMYGRDILHSQRYCVNAKGFASSELTLTAIFCCPPGEGRNMQWRTRRDLYGFLVLTAAELLPDLLQQAQSTGKQRLKSLKDRAVEVVDAVRLLTVTSHTELLSYDCSPGRMSGKVRCYVYMRETTILMSIGSKITFHSK